MSIPAKREESLKRHIYTRDEAKLWLQTKQQVDAEIVSGDTGESFAVYFFPSQGVKNVNFKKLVGNVAQLLDLDKPYANISSIQLVKYKNKTALRIGWSS
jgi:hypothetical protein